MPLRAQAFLCTLRAVITTKRYAYAHINTHPSAHGIIAVLVALVCFLVWRMARKDDELRFKNRVIVDEVERRHRVIDRAVKLGVNRAALL